MQSQFLRFSYFLENVFVAISCCKENDDEKDDGNTVKKKIYIYMPFVLYLYEEIRKCETRVCHFVSLFKTEIFFFFFSKEIFRIIGFLLISKVNWVSINKFLKHIRTFVKTTTKQIYLN